MNGRFAEEIRASSPRLLQEKGILKRAAKLFAAELPYSSAARVFPDLTPPAPAQKEIAFGAGGRR